MGWWLIVLAVVMWGISGLALGFAMAWHRDRPPRWVALRADAECDATATTPNGCADPELVADTMPESATVRLEGRSFR